MSAPGAVASPGDDVAVVSSARDLWQAVSEGLQHIEVQAHLNLATDGDPQAGSILFEMYNSVRSLRVRVLSSVVDNQVVIFFSMSFLTKLKA